MTDELLHENPLIETCTVWVRNPPGAGYASEGWLGEPGVRLTYPTGRVIEMTWQDFALTNMEDDDDEE